MRRPRQGRDPARLDHPYLQAGAPPAGTVNTTSPQVGERYRPRHPTRGAQSSSPPVGCSCRRQAASGRGGWRPFQLPRTGSSVACRSAFQFAEGLSGAGEVESCPPSAAVRCGLDADVTGPRAARARMCSASRSTWSSSPGGMSCRWLRARISTWFRVSSSARCSEMRRPPSCAAERNRARPPSGGGRPSAGSPTGAVRPQPAGQMTLNRRGRLGRRGQSRWRA